MSIRANCEHRFLYFEVVIPFVLVLVVYFPLGFILIKQDAHLFHRVFATADLLGICLAVFISTYVDLEEADLQAERNLLGREPHAQFLRGRTQLRIMKGALFLYALMVFVTFLGIKIDMLQFEFPKDGVLSERVRFYSTLCLIALLMSVIICCMARRISFSLRKLP